MVLDYTTVISGAVGSLIAMIGSIIVAFLYIKHQNNLEKYKLINQQIQKTYLDEGIFPLQEAITEYAISCIFTFMDYRKYLNIMFIDMKNEKLFIEKINDLKERPPIKDLMQRKFGIAMEPLSHIRGLGNPIYGSIIKTFQIWSELITDVLNWTVMKKTN